MSELTSLSATALSAMIASRAASAVEVMEAHLDRITCINKLSTVYAFHYSATIYIETSANSSCKRHERLT